MTGAIQLAPERRKRSERGRTRKYRNVPTVVDGIRFDSRAESRRWLELKLMEKCGMIRELERQVSYDLPVNGEIVCRYRADFVYRLPSGEITVEDIKSPASITAAYRIKAKLMKAIWGITISEVRA